MESRNFESTRRVFAEKNEEELKTLLLFNLIDVLDQRSLRILNSRTVNNRRADS